MEYSVWRASFGASEEVTFGASEEVAPRRFHEITEQIEWEGLTSHKTTYQNEWEV